ncbi:hypothetical protein HN51_026700, partial [Arachis hypogaea]
MKVLADLVVTLADRKTVTELGFSSPAINSSIVDLPIPFGPTTFQQHYLTHSRRAHVFKTSLKKRCNQAGISTMHWHHKSHYNHQYVI